MSKIRSAPLKKAHSLALDRRNAYGESPHGSRKSIPRARRRKHKDERRAVAAELAHATGEVDDDSASLAEHAAKTAALAALSSNFRKLPDVPLKDIIARKIERRARAGETTT